jgi:hypothetical protein
MKTLSIITVLLFCSLVLQKEVHAGKTSDVMYSVYKQSFSDPITFDTYIAQNKNLFDAEYFACTNRLLLKYAGRAKELADCRGYADAQMQQRCMAQYGCSRKKWGSVVQNIGREHQLLDQSIV